jgi:hypothetical protein
MDSLTVDLFKSVAKKRLDAPRVIQVVTVLTAALIFPFRAACRPEAEELFGISDRPR